MSKKQHSTPKSQPTGKPTNNPGDSKKEVEIRGNVPTMRNPPPPPPKKKD